MPYNLYDPSTYRVGNPQTNWLLKIWKVLLDNPLGIVYLMPAVILVPYGFLVMWRKDNHEFAILCASVILLAFLQTVITSVPVTVESLGSRMMVPAFPVSCDTAGFSVGRGNGGEMVDFDAYLSYHLYVQHRLVDRYGPRGRNIPGDSPGP